MNAHRVVKHRIIDRQAKSNIAYDLDSRSSRDIGIGPTWRGKKSTPPIQALHHDQKPFYELCEVHIRPGLLVRNSRSVTV
jgi:hypothetical protein